MLKYNVAVDHKELAKMCDALGDPVRAHILQFLLGCCCCGSVAITKEGGVVPKTQGPSAGEICCHLTGDQKINSNISFHLKELREAGLISMERHGKYMMCSPNQEAMTKLADFFGNAKNCSNCC
jgi:ArsR family transcriptional regulator, arsenate/arsenite/antimonite-responsive transcriptional repressor